MINEPPQNSDNALMNAFNNQTNKNEFAETIKELFNEKKISMITDLTKDEVKLLTRIYTISKLKKLKVWEDGINWYLKLMLSSKRQSRKELLDAIRGSPMNPQNGFMGRLNPMNWGNKRF